MNLMYFPVIDNIPWWWILLSGDEKYFLVMNLIPVWRILIPVGEYYVLVVKIIPWWWTKDLLVMNINPLWWILFLVVNIVSGGEYYSLVVNIVPGGEYYSLVVNIVPRWWILFPGSEYYLSLQNSPIYPPAKSWALNPGWSPGNHFPPSLKRRSNGVTGPHSRTHGNRAIKIQ